MTTVRLYFRNLMLFVNRDDGTDVWFMPNHAAHVLTAGRSPRKLEGSLSAYSMELSRCQAVAT